MVELLDIDQARSRLESLLDDVSQALAPHDNCRADDDQYEDPQEWWLRPLKANLEQALIDLDN